MVKDSVQRAGARNRADGFGNFAWTGLAVLSTVVLALVVVGGIIDAASGQWLTLLGTPLAALVWFWIAGGAWRRTTWGRSTA